MRHIILGTAGHIDHGKSALVKALTGIDPDRLKEEKERGITIDIGFADLLYAEDNLVVGIVDVPGHEKLVRNMLAGAGGIDIVLLVIAADEGIMPQSREHLAICNLLKIKSGLIALTKTDLVEQDWLDLVRDETRNFVKGTFLQDAPIIPVSARSGDNLEVLKQEIRDRALQVTPKPSDGLFRLPIDRVFTLKGFGTVVTGTAISGKISLDDPLEILPGNIKTKVRGLHSHGKSIRTAYAGQRVAVNLQSVEKEDISRGNALVTPSSFSQTKIIDASLELLDDTPVVRNKSLVHFYTSTSETIARVILYELSEVKPGEKCFCQLRLQDPVIAVAGDRYIIRRFSPLETLGGGEILDPAPARRRRREGITDLALFETGTLGEKISLKISQAGIRGMTLNALEGWINAELKSVSDALKKLAQDGEILQHEGLLLHKKSLLLIRKKILDMLDGFHNSNPLKQGMPKEEVRTQLKIDPRLFNYILSGIENIVVEKNLLRKKDFQVALSHGEESNKEKIMEILEKGGFQPITKEELSSVLKMDQKHMADILHLMVKEGNLVKISDSIYLTAGSYHRMIDALKSFFAKKKEISVAEFRDMMNTSRKYALPFLEYLDSKKVTLRTGDVRKFLLKD